MCHVVVFWCMYCVVWTYIVRCDVMRRCVLLRGVLGIVA